MDIKNYIGDGVLETFVRVGNESIVADSTEHSVLFYADTTLHLTQGQAKSRLVIIPSVSSEAVIMRGMGPVSMTSSFSRSAWSTRMEC